MFTFWKTSRFWRSKELYARYRGKGARREGPFEYEGPPFGPALVGPNEVGDETVVEGPNLPTATIAAVPSVLRGNLDIWEFEGSVGSDRIVARRGKVRLLSRESEKVTITTPQGDYVLMKDLFAGVGWWRPDGSELLVYGRFVRDATPTEVSMVLVAECAGMTLHVGQHLI